MHLSQLWGAFASQRLYVHHPPWLSSPCKWFPLEYIYTLILTSVTRDEIGIFEEDRNMRWGRWEVSKSVVVVKQMIHVGVCGCAPSCWGCALGKEGGNRRKNNEVEMGVKHSE